MKLIISLNTRNGLLSPEGNLYACDYEGHGELAEEICAVKFPEHTLVGGSQDFLMRVHGYAKLYTESWQGAKSGWATMTRATTAQCSDWDTTLARINQKQRDTIFDWSVTTVRPLPESLQPKEQNA
jgi:hypothetical protein